MRLFLEHLLVQNLKEYEIYMYVCVYTHMQHVCHKTQRFSGTTISMSQFHSCANILAEIFYQFSYRTVM